MSKSFARQGAMAIFVDLARDISTELAVNSLWQIAVMDDAERPIFRLRLLAEAA